SNIGHGETGDVAWFENVWLSDQPTLNTLGATNWLLDSVMRTGGLVAGESVTTTRTYNLAPSVTGKYLIVDVDPQPDSRIREENELNNQLAAASVVTARPADLRVTQIVVPQQNFSGEKVTVQYTVTNFGADVWSETKYWNDAIIFSQSPILAQSNPSNVPILV